MRPIGYASLLFAFLLPSLAFADPYVQGLWTKNAPIYVSEGATFMPSSLAYDRAFTNIAFAYHPLSAGSIIPTKLQPWLPPESWACTLGGTYASRSGGGPGAGIGCGLNLLDSVRAWAAELLVLSSNATAAGIGQQIKPGQGPANLFVSRQWDDTFEHPGRFAPRWFFGASFGF